MARNIPAFTAIAIVGWASAMPAHAVTIRRETLVNAPAAFVWAAVKDVGEVDKRLARGFVVETTLDGETRSLTFANGRVVQEVIMGVDDTARRLAYSAVNGRAAHHAASLQVLSEGSGSRLIWITDVLPDTLEVPIGSLMEDGIAAMKSTLEKDARAAAGKR